MQSPTRQALSKHPLWNLSALFDLTTPTAYAASVRLHPLQKNSSLPESRLLTENHKSIKMDASKQPVKLVKVTRVLGRTGTKPPACPTET